MCIRDRAKAAGSKASHAIDGAGRRYRESARGLSKRFPVQQRIQPCLRECADQGHTGTLHASVGPRTGTFALQHSGTMTRGVPELNITVVPDSGTGQLVGLTGKLIIHIADGKHSYDFEYTLPEAP